MARLARVLRLLSKIEAFDSLFLMIAAMRGSLVVLMWSAVLLVFFQLVIALLIGQFLDEFVRDTRNPIERRIQIFEYFGTCSRATLTMFEIALGNWPPVARILQESVNELWIIFSITHKLTIGFAVIGVINGVFMHETFKVASSDDRTM